MTSRRKAASAAPTRWPLALASAFLLAGVAGCGQPADTDPGVSAPTGDASDDTATSPGADPGAGGTDLTVVVTDGQGTSTWTLTCGPPGGTHPDPAQACTALAAAGPDPLAPLPKEMACTQVYGGPQTATVAGTWDGVAVAADLDRTDGCQIARWDALLPVLQPGAAPDATDA
jgi:hypothetical protein